MSSVFWIVYWSTHTIALIFLSCCYYFLPSPSQTQPASCRFFLSILKDSVAYGKATPSTTLPALSSLKVPKKWFKHFYIVGFIVNCFVANNFFGCRAMLLFRLHVTRRLFESFFVTTFSPTATMHLSHYLLGLTYYFAVPWTINSCEDCQSREGSIFATGACLLAQFSQFQSHFILAKLRSSKSTNVSLSSYSIPRGLNFEYVSCPHYTAEIVMYFSLASMTSWCPAMSALCIFVLFELAFSSRIQHEWYQEKFIDYPRERRALIPFVL
jgi:3-oxo-5-alpha-steroid 4-dehydrogenase 3 / polyprenol reductase